MVQPPDDLSSCPLCNAQGHLFKKISSKVYDRQFDLHKCGSCSICYTYPSPPLELLEKIYSGEYWLRENKVGVTKSLTGIVQSFNRARLAAMIQPLTKRLSPGDRILEVGCGSGQLAVYLHQSGYDVDVTDVSQEILTEISDNYGIKGYCGDLQNIVFPPQPYQAVIFNNVLEHLHAPGENLLRAHQLLDQNGYVFIEVPNIDSIQFTLFRENWFPLQLPEHLFHFSPRSLQGIITELGFDLTWLSTFSPRVSPAGYVASLFPTLRPDRLRQSMSKPLLVIYLGLQMFFLPAAYFESLFGRGSAVRVIYQKVKRK